MRRYLKSMALLALIAALLMGCNTIPDTPDVPEDVKEPDLSTITKLEYELHPLNISPPTAGYVASLPFKDRFYPLDHGSWAMKETGYTESTANGIMSGKNTPTQLAIRAVNVIDASGIIPNITPSSPAAQGRILYHACTLAMAFDTGDLLTCIDYSLKFKNYKRPEALKNIREYWMSGELIRDNRFSRIANSDGGAEWLYQQGPFTPDIIIPHYALYDRFTRLTDYKYCELYASGDIFLGLYVDKNKNLHCDVISETGEILRSEAADLREEYPEEKNDYGYDGLTVKRDSDSKLYFYANAKGDAVCEPAFTNCTNIKNGTAIVMIKDELYMLVVTSAE